MKLLKYQGLVTFDIGSWSNNADVDERSRKNWDSGTLAPCQEGGPTKPRSHSRQNGVLEAMLHHAIAVLRDSSDG